MKDPAVLFYTQDFLTGSAFFNDEQRGQYIRLLCEQHQLGHIPENHMLSICKSLASPVVKKFVKDSYGNYYNIRMEEEVLKRQNFVQSRIDNGKKGGRHKKPNAKAYAKPNGLAKNNLSDNVNENVIKELYKGVEIFFDEDCRPKTEKAKSEWYDTLDKLIRIDGYTPEHIHDVIKRARMDDFWRTNFLSVLKLRKKNRDGISYFTVFEKKLNHEATGRNNSHSASHEELTNFYGGQYGSDAAEYR